MINESGIDKLLAPIIQRQEAINNYIIRRIAMRVRAIGRLLPSDVYALQRLLKSGSDVRDINKQLAKITKLQEKDIKKLIEYIAKDAYADAKPFYDYRNKSFIPFSENIPLQRVVKAVQNQTLGTYRNLSKSQGFMLRDLRNPKVLKPTTVAKTYQSVIDEAVQASQSGVVDYNTAMRRTMKQLSDSGLRYITYQTESGKPYTQRMDTAVRRNLMDGIRAINQGVQDEVGKQYGADGKEITVHMNAAPDHEPIQGHQFTNEEYDKLQNAEAFQNVNGKKFAPIERAIGTLNCRHFTYSIIIGINKPNFSQKQLDAMIAKNQKGYTTPSGEHLTMYECTQEQRRLETKIREQKERQMTFEICGDKVGASDARAKVQSLTKEYKAFSQACGLSVQSDRMRVSGYTK